MGSQGERDSLVTLVTLVTLWTPIKKGRTLIYGKKGVSGVTSVTASRRLSGRGRGLGRLPPAGRLRERAAFRRRLKRATRPAWAV